ncbi:MAG: radical SAM protein, partial [Actinobacteria bacterium]
LVLPAITPGRYAAELADARLPQLVAAIAETGVARLRLSSIEPPDLTPELLSVLAETPAACPHLHVPLQSGSDAVLAAMRRTYTTVQYVEWIDAAREALPGLAVTTDVMAGFPGETDEQAAETLAFVERIGFAMLHVFRYSVRPGTPAAGMEQVDPGTRACRAEALRALGERMRTRHAHGRVGELAEVLVERVVDGVAEGTTRDYLRVRFEAGDGDAPGTLVNVRLAVHDDGDLLHGRRV